MEIGTDLINSITLSVPSKLLSQSTNEQAFGNGKAIVEVGRLHIRMDTDRGDVYAKLSTSKILEDGVSIYSILLAIGQRSLDDRSALTIKEFAEILNHHYDEIVGLMVDEKRREQARDLEKRANEIWMKHMEKISFEFRQQKKK